MRGRALSWNYYASLCTMCDALGICKFSCGWFATPIYLKEMGELATAATGVDFNEKKVREVVARINNVERAYLVREGITRKDDTIHGRAMEEPVPSGPYKGERLDPGRHGQDAGRLLQSCRLGQEDGCTYPEDAGRPGVEGRGG